MTEDVCRRCGLCCLRGGPTLMVEDATLVATGPLQLEQLVCLRTGEWARDDARGLVRPLAAEMLKLAHWRTDASHQAHPWRCPCLEQGTGSTGGAFCTIYQQRPVQCSLLSCMDTSPLQECLATGKMLDRAGLLAALPAEVLPPQAAAVWQELAAAHEAACPAGECLDLAARLGYKPRGKHVVAGEEGSADTAEIRTQLTELVRLDAAWRELSQSRAAVPADVLPFLLGRPLTALLAEVGCHPARLP